MKRCFKCGEMKDDDEFYKHKPMADGHLGKCKECTKRDVHDNYIKRIAHYREYERARFSDPERKADIASYSKTRRINHPEKCKAKRLLDNAIRDGKIVRQPCERCGASKAQAHHPDYGRPLDVVWLCFKCHRKEHGQLQYEAAV